MQAFACLRLFEDPFEFMKNCVDHQYKFGPTCNAPRLRVERNVNCLGITIVIGMHAMTSIIPIPRRLKLSTDTII